MKTPEQETVKNALYSKEERAKRKLFDAVIKQLGGDWEDVWNDPEAYRNPESGVAGFLWYNETEPFAKENIKEILDVLGEFEEEIGENLKKKKPYLNWYAWFALESVIDDIMRYQEEQLEEE